MIVSFILSVITFLPALAVMVRRFHNLKMSGFWILLYFPTWPSVSALFLNATGKSRKKAALLWGIIPALPFWLLVTVAFISGYKQATNRIKEQKMIKQTTEIARDINAPSVVNTNNK